MAEKNINARVQHKHDVEANWLKASGFVPKQGEIVVYDVDSTHTYERMKIGDGTTVVGSLPFVNDEIRQALTSGTTKVSKAETADRATTADSATNAQTAQTAVSAQTANSATVADTALVANSATKATQDGNGQVIADTYETKADAANKLNEAKTYTDQQIENATDGCITGMSVSGKVITYTKGDGSTGTVTTQDTTYSNATTSEAGLMSVDDKTKVDKIATNLVNGSQTGSLRSIDSSAEDSSYSLGQGAFALGYKTKASGDHSHAEGSNTTASGKFSHAEGAGTTASGSHSHAEGYVSTASGNYSHAEGYGTIAASANQHVQGKKNIEDSADKYAHIVGNGSASGRSNAHTLDWDGLGWFAGGLKVGGTSQDDTDAVEVALKTEATTTSAGLLSAADKQKLDGIAAGATANTGDITGVTAGTGLSGGGTSGSVTLSLGTVGTAGTYGPTANVSGTNGTTIKVPQITVDAYGRVTSVTERTYTSKDTTYTTSDGITLTGTNFTNSGVRSISTGSSNGTISVNTNGTSADVKVKGLGTAAYTASTAYDAAGSANTALTNAKAYTDTAIAGVTPATIGALSTSGGTIAGDLYLGDGTNTLQYDLYIRRSMDEVLKSGRLYWGTGGVLRLQAASADTIFNFMDLKPDGTTFKQPVMITGGGTGAATAEEALSNLGGVNKAGDTMTGILDMDAKIIMKNGIAIQGEDSEGVARHMIYLSSANRLQIGYGMPDNYCVQINPMIRLSSKNYGTTLPDAGNSGRLFFKKVSS